MNDRAWLEKLHRNAPTEDRQQQLFERIQAVFKKAIEARSPKRRPPGKAGLKAEKGYYRLLYLEDEFQKKVGADNSGFPDGRHHGWDQMSGIVRQLGDLPDLQSEIMAGIESALDEMEPLPNNHCWDDA